MSLRAAIAADALTVILNNDDFAETITYYPRGGGDREIKAVVDRDSASVFSEDGTVSFLWMIHVANNKESGITGEELDLGGDKLGFPPRDGTAVQVRSIHRLLDTDHGMHYLEVR